jgi:DNA-binding NarL/FixJ family response regulator
MIKVAIVDDNPGLANRISENLEKFSGIAISFIAQGGGEALKLIPSSNPDIILMDIQMPDMDGIESTKRIKHLFPSVRIIILSVFDDPENIFAAILAGASGYLLKDEKTDRIVESIKEVLEGGAPMSPAIARKALDIIRNNNVNKVSESEEPILTPRELEILNYTAGGKTYQQIAELLFISPKTVRKHIENIYSKLQVHNKTEAINKARKSGFLQL